MDRCQHDLLPTVGEVCSDDAAVLALSVTRFIAAGYMTREVACWYAAYNAAENVLGEAEAPAFVAAMTGVMRAIRADRAADWSFMPATCCRVTPHEQELLALVELARSPPESGLPEGAARLAGIAAAPRLAGALARVAGLMEPAQLRLSEAAVPLRGVDGQRSRAPSTVH